MDDGGYAFPRQIDRNDQGDTLSGYEYGMTLRDWFAGQALAGLSARSGSTSWERMAEDCYRQADAMLEAKKVAAGS